jgi:aryl-alcohol dehydrogenase-like predicted oxidoreductase
VIPYSPLGGGVLTGKYRRGKELPESQRADENADIRFSERNWTIVERLVEVSKREGLTPAQAAIQWMRAKPWMTSPIVGANRPDQLEEILSGLDRPLSTEGVAALDEVSDFERSRPTREE